MSIVTKTGDEGLTSLLSGERVWKDDLRVEAYGTVDELSAVLGLARHGAQVAEVVAVIDEVQHDLVRLGGELASRAAPFGRPIGPADEERLTAKVAELEGRIPLRGFVIPGMTESSARLDQARTVARRAERRVVALARDADISEALRRYLNRLSDLLFMLARAEEDAVGAIRFS
ncbi:MAG TPA: cob(I)yrinic acid a,c-diamide adenosyltransferase [Rectinemataceae bacterium]|nr:cob(I)yrinic acid a,c-diamide adenosyltransferase [Rectinemataceae bacterium]